MGSPKKLRADGFGPDVDTQEAPTVNEFGPQVFAPQKSYIRSDEEQGAIDAESQERLNEKFLRYLADQGAGTVRSMFNGAAFGTIPKAAATLGAVGDAISGKPDWDEEFYKYKTDLEKKYSQAEQDAPVSNFVGMMSTPVGKIGGFAKGLNVASKLGKVAISAGEGILQANALTGLSRAASDEPRPSAALEHGISSVVGGGLGLVSGAGGAAVDALSSRIAKAKAAQLAQSTAAIEKNISSSVGALGGETQAGHRSLEVLREAASNESLPYEVRIRAMELLESPDAAKLAESVATSAADRFPSRNAAIGSARETLEGLLASKPADIAVHAENAGKEVMSKEAWPRLKRQLFREAPTMIGAGLGMAVGDDAGERSEFGLIGAGLGKIAAMGQPGTAWANMMRKPAVQGAMASLAQKPFQMAQGVGQFFNPTPVIGEESGEMFSKYLSGEKPAERGTEEEGQANFQRNR